MHSRDVTAATPELEFRQPRAGRDEPPVLALQRKIGNAATRRLLARQSQTGVQPAAAAEARPWENPMLLQDVYPLRDEMLRRFLRIYREIEMRGLEPRENDEAAAADRRAELLAEVRRTAEAIRTRLTEAGANTPQDRQTLAAALRALRALDGRDAAAGWRAAIEWERRHAGDDLQGTDLRQEVEATFDHANVPQWLRRPVLDYAGMRYSSAHGSYYAPQVLLYLLEESEGLFERDRAEAEETWAAAHGGRHRRRAPRRLTDRQHEILGMSAAEAIAQLRNPPERYQRQRAIPNWVWREVIRLTTLRNSEATEGWQTRAQAPAAANRAEEDENAYWQNILAHWRSDRALGEIGRGSTGWLHEQFREQQVVTTRMVCNQLAEAVAASRGIRMRGGITGDANQYAAAQGESMRGGDSAPANFRGAYFLNSGPRDPRRTLPIATREHFRPGAGLFFIASAWSQTQPPPESRVLAVAGATYPMLVSAEHERDRDRYIAEHRAWESRRGAHAAWERQQAQQRGRQGPNARGREPAPPGPEPQYQWATEANARTIPPGHTVIGAWTYHVVAGQPVTRTYGANTLPGAGVRTEWMRWAHEATVMGRIGDRVFTIETTDRGGAGRAEEDAHGARAGSGFSVRNVREMLAPPWPRPIGGVFVGWMPERERRPSAGGARR